MMLMSKRPVYDVRNTPNKLYWLLFRISLVALLVILVVAGLGIARVYQAYVVDSAKQTAIRMAQSLSAIDRDLFIKSGVEAESRVAVDPEDYSKLNTTLTQLMDPHDIVKIKIFSTERTIVFSTDPE